MKCCTVVRVTSLVSGFRLSVKIQLHIIVNIYVILTSSLSITLYRVEHRKTHLVLFCLVL